MIDNLHEGVIPSRVDECEVEPSAAGGRWERVHGCGNSWTVLNLRRCVTRLLLPTTTASQAEVAVRNTDKFSTGSCRRSVFAWRCCLLHSLSSVRAAMRAHSAPRYTSWSATLARSTQFSAGDQTYSPEIKHTGSQHTASGIHQIEREI